jgi:hypothetical protein
MIRINSENGVIRLGPFSLFWQNPEPEYPGFTVLAYKDTSIEFGDIDAGNGIHITRFKDGEIFSQQVLLKLP